MIAVNYNYKPDEPNRHSIKKNTLLDAFALITTLGFIGGLIHYVTNIPNRPVIEQRETIKNETLEGIVLDEKILLGDVVRGYSVPDKGLKGLAEEKLNGLLRPGEQMYVYALLINNIEYDSEKGHVKKDYRVYLKENEKISEENSNIVYLQSEGDIAEKGQKFKVSKKELGRLSATFAARGVKYRIKDIDGNEKTVILREVLKNPGKIKFE